MKPFIIDLEPRHVIEVCGHLGPFPVPVDDMIAAYMSPGSIGKTMCFNGNPVACGGIINIGWRRGEAWILAGPQVNDCKKSFIGFAKQLLESMAIEKRFRRVQATCHENSSHLFDILGFKHEARLHAFGPIGESVEIYYRLFEV